MCHMGPGGYQRKYNLQFVLLISDAEPKYLIAVQPIPANEVKKQCTGMSVLKEKYVTPL